MRHRYRPFVSVDSAGDAAVVWGETSRLGSYASGPAFSTPRVRV